MLCVFDCEELFFSISKSSLLELTTVGIQFASKFFILLFDLFRLLALLFTFFEFFVLDLFWLFFELHLFLLFFSFWLLQLLLLLIVFWLLQLLLLLSFNLLTCLVVDRPRLWQLEFSLLLLFLPFWTFLLLICLLEFWILLLLTLFVDFWLLQLLLLLSFDVQACLVSVRPRFWQLGPAFSTFFLRSNSLLVSPLLANSTHGSIFFEPFFDFFDSDLGLSVKYYNLKQILDKCICKLKYFFLISEI